MKITPEHYNHMKEEMAENMAKVPFAKYEEQGLSAKRYRWDLFWASGLSEWLCSTLYPYLNDEHVDTALRRITNTGSKCPKATLGCNPL